MSILFRMTFALLVLASCLTVGTARAAASQAPLNIAFYLPAIRDANLSDLRASLQMWAEEVGRPFALDAHALLYDDMTILRRAMQEGMANLVVAPGMEIAEAFRPEEIAEGFVGIRQGGMEGVVLIASADSGIRKFADLRGRKVLGVSNDRLSDVFLEIHCLRQVGVGCRDLFTRGEEKRDALAIHKVFFGQADAALVSLNAFRVASELNPQVRERSRVVLEWRVKSLNFGMMTVRSPKAYRELVRMSALDAVRTTRGKQILELFKTETMVKAEPSDLLPYWQLLKEYRELTQSTPARKK